jgi:hypothetical protein
MDYFLKPVVAVSRRLPGGLRTRVQAPGRVVRGWLRTASVWSATRYVLVVVTRDEVLRLGRPVPPAPGGSAVVPPPYDAPTCPQLRRAVDEVLGPVDTSGRLARVWTTYEDRVRYTAVAFHSRHDHPSLRKHPMDAAEISVVIQERIEDLQDRAAEAEDAADAALLTESAS